MALASTAAAIAGPGVAAEPTTYAVASGTAAVAAWIMVGVRGSYFRTNRFAEPFFLFFFPLYFGWEGSLARRG
jgi:hypothetical protein